MRRIAFSLLFAVSACATASAPISAPTAPAPMTPEARALSFQLEYPPEESMGKAMELWSTHYFTPIVSPAPANSPAAFPLMGRKGQAISPALSHRDWCKAALQGSVSIRSGDGVESAYVFVDSNGPEQVNCDDHLGKLSDGVKMASRKARFMKVGHPYGCGVRSIPLMPYRTIAVDTAVIPLETVLFIPRLKGQAFELDGRHFFHDGYVFAGDRGGAIRGAHIDFFTAHLETPPFPNVISSTASKTFPARIVSSDLPAAQALKANHTSQCNDDGPPSGG